MLHNREITHVKIFLGVKTCRKSEFDIFKAKKRFPDSGKACILNRKVAKIASGKLFFALKMSNSDFSHVFYPQRGHFQKFFHVGGLCSSYKPCLRKGSIFQQKLLENSGVTTLGGHSSEKIFKILFLEMTPLGVKTCRESAFDIFKEKNTSLIQKSPKY